MPSKLNQKELDILNILKQSEHPLAISEVVALDPSYTTSIVQPIMRKLESLNMIEVADIVYNKKSLTRRFRVTASTEKILAQMLSREYKSYRRLFSSHFLLASMVQTELDNSKGEEEIQRLEQILNELKADTAKKNQIPHDRQ